jgi:hypothetical protein
MYRSETIWGRKTALKCILNKCNISVRGINSSGSVCDPVAEVNKVMNHQLP